MASAITSSISCGRRPAEGGDVLLRYHRVVERIVLVVELDDRARQLGSFLDAESLRQRAGRDIAHHHFERNDLDLANQLLAHVEPADEMRRHSNVVEVLEDVFRDAIVEHALAFDHLVLFRVEGGRVVLEVLDQCSGLRSLIEDLGLAFVDAATAAHRRVPWFVNVHLDAVAPVGMIVRGGGTRGGDLGRDRQRVHMRKLADRGGQHNRDAGNCSRRDSRANHCAIGCLDHLVPICKAAHSCKERQP